MTSLFKYYCGICIAQLMPFSLSSRVSVGRAFARQRRRAKALPTISSLFKKCPSFRGFSPECCPGGSASNFAHHRLFFICRGLSFLKNPQIFPIINVNIILSRIVSYFFLIGTRLLLLLWRQSLRCSIPGRIPGTRNSCAICWLKTSN